MALRRALRQQGSESLASNHPAPSARSTRFPRLGAFTAYPKSGILATERKVVNTVGNGAGTGFVTSANKEFGHGKN